MRLDQSLHTDEQRTKMNKISRSETVRVKDSLSVVVCDDGGDDKRKDGSFCPSSSCPSLWTERCALQRTLISQTHFQLSSVLYFRLIQLHWLRPSLCVCVCVCIVPVTLARPSSSSSARALVSVSLADGVNLQRVHTYTRVKHLNKPTPEQQALQRAAETESYLFRYKL